MYISNACIFSGWSFWHSSAVYFQRFVYVILETLIEGWRDSCLTEIRTVIKMTLMLLVSCWLLSMMVRRWICVVTRFGVLLSSFYAIITLLHGMQMRSSDETFICLSVCQTRDL